MPRVYTLNPDYKPEDFFPNIKHEIPEDVMRQVVDVLGPSYITDGFYLQRTPVSLAVGPVHNHEGSPHSKSYTQ